MYSLYRNNELDLSTPLLRDTIKDPCKCNLSVIEINLVYIYMQTSLQELGGQSVDLSSQLDVADTQTSDVMGRESDLNAVVDVEPFRVVIHL